MLRTPSTKSATRSTQGHTSAPIEVNGNSHCFDRVESRAWLDTSMLCGPVRYSRPIAEAEHCAARDRGRPQRRSRSRFRRNGRSRARLRYASLSSRETVQLDLRAAHSIAAAVFRGTPAEGLPIRAVCASVMPRGAD